MVRRLLSGVTVLMVVLAGLTGLTLGVGAPHAGATTPTCEITVRQLRGTPNPNLIDVSGDTCTIGSTAGPVGVTVYHKFVLKNCAHDLPCDSEDEARAYPGGEYGDGSNGGIACGDDAKPTGYSTFYPYPDTEGITCRTDTRNADGGAETYGMTLDIFVINNADRSDTSEYWVSYLVQGAGRLPVASFGDVPVVGKRNTFQFDASTSHVTTSGASIVSYAWDFGDGTSGTGVRPVHTYPRKGDYTATLTVTDSTGKSGTTSSVITAPDSDLSAKLTVTAPDGSLITGDKSEVGKTLLATVTLEAAPEATAAITGITADPPVDHSPDASLSAPGDADPGVPTTLAPGHSASYSVPFTIQAPGSVVLSVAAEGMEGSTPVSASASRVARLGQPISVSVLWRKDGQPFSLNDPGKPPQPDTLRLADDDNGEIAQDVTAVVRLKNTSSVTQKTVSIDDIPALSFHDPSQALPTLPISVTAGPDPATIPDLDPGDSVDVNYTVHILRNGSFDFSPLVLSSQDGSNVNNVSQGVGTVTALPTHLLVLSLHLSDSKVRAGDPATVSGKLINRSLTQTLDVDPLEPVNVTGNVGGGRLVDDTSPASYAASLLADGVQIPFFGELKPGQELLVTGRLDTTYIPGTRAELSYDPHASVTDDSGAAHQLPAGQIRVTKGSSPVTLHVDASDPAVPAASAREVVQNFTDGAVQGAAAWADGELRGALNLLMHPVTGGSAALKSIASMVVNAPANLASSAYILGEAELYADAWLVLTPAQRQTFEKRIIDDFDASSVKGNNAEMAQSIQAGMQGFEDAAYKGDYNKLAGLAGHGLASGGGLVADAVLTDIFFQSLGLGMKVTAKAGTATAKGYLANALVLADEIKNAHLPEAALKYVKDVKAGQNLLVENAKALTGMWGLLPEQITALQKFCRENDIIVAVRQRSKRAAALIKRGLAIGKNEVLKLKGVNEIDVEYLGYHDTDLNQLVFAEPIPRSHVVAKLDAQGVNAHTKAIVLERYDLRAEEWTSPKVRDVMHKADRVGEIEWGFNGTDNGAPGADKSAKRRFSLYERPHEHMPGSNRPRKYQEVFVGDKPGRHSRLVRVTQDNDMAALLSSNGEILSPALRTKAYEFLSDALGIEHPETASWINLGELDQAAQTLFKGKLKELRRLLPGGGEVLAVFGPDGTARAGFLDAATSVYNAKSRGGRIFFHGGYNNPYAKTIARITVSLKHLIR